MLPRSTHETATTPLTCKHALRGWSQYVNARPYSEDVYRRSIARSVAAARQRASLLLPARDAGPCSRDARSKQRPAVPSRTSRKPAPTRVHDGPSGRCTLRVVHQANRQTRKMVIPRINHSNHACSPHNTCQQQTSRRAAPGATGPSAEQYRSGVTAVAHRSRRKTSFVAATAAPLRPQRA